jgi:signal transduction histidine kinase
VKATLHERLLSLHLNDEADFLLARQRAKHVAGLLGFEQQDQTRVATAVSEIARNAYEYAGGGQVEYLYDATPAPQLRIVISDKGRGIAELENIWAGKYKSATGMGLGLIGARRLLDRLDVVSGPQGTTVTLVKALPNRAKSPLTLEGIAAKLSGIPVNRQIALRNQNQELLTLLGELRAREVELQSCNEELEETNRGVLVLYAELEDKAQAVQSASESKTRFLSGVTHELRTPLNSIISLGRVMLLRQDGDLNPEQDKQVQFILRCAQNLTDMVNDLLDMAKVESGAMTLNVLEFRVSDTLASLRGLFRPLTVSHRVKLIFDVPDEALRLSSDEGKLSQILRNLISNALKFTEEGTITVSAAQTGRNEVLFKIADTGIGIAPHHFDLIMQDWGQVERVASSVQKGSGLGLPLSKRFASLLGGKLWFESTLGAGSTFYVSIPKEVLQLSFSEKPSVAVKPLQHVLIADEDEVARYLLKCRLSSLTMTPILEVKDGAECVRAIAANLPQILFLDFMASSAPKLSGREIAQRLRSRPETTDLPIVVVTSAKLTEEEESWFDSLSITVIAKLRGNSGGDQAEQDEHRMLLERSLLQVGLNNLNEQVTNE